MNNLIQTRRPVLIIDDAHEIHLMLKQLISDAFADLRIAYANTGLHGIEMASLETPCVIILDLILPDLHGFEVCARLKQNPNLVLVPVIFLTGTQSEAEIRIRALEAGGEAFLTKPFDKAELLALLKAMIQLSEARHRLYSEKLELDKLVNDKTLVLKESHHNYQMLFDNATIAIVIEQDGIVKLCNKKVSEYLGFKPEQLMGKPYIDLIFPDDRLQIWEKHQQRMQTHAPLQKTAFRLITSDGGFIWVEAEAIFSEWEGKPANLGFLTDITRQVNAYQRLMVSEERYRNIFNNSSIGIYQTTPEGTYRTVNKAFAYIFGFDSPEQMVEDVKNIGIQLYANPDDRTKIVELLNKEPWEISNFETQGKKRDGTLFWASINARKVMDPVSGQQYFEGSCSDITDKKEAQIALDQHSRLIKSLTDAAQDAILMMDHHGMISYWNPAAERIFGFTEQEALGQNLHTLLAPSRYHQSHLEAYERFLTTGSGNAIGKTLELEAYRKDGETISVELSLSAVLVNENWHATGIMRDITQRKRAELELKHAKEKAEESDKLKTAFLNNISHEIRTPFNGILGFISMLLDDDIPKEDKQEFAEIIQLSAERLMTTINNIVEMSRLQSGELELKLAEFRLTSVFESLMYHYKPEAFKKGLGISIVSQLNDAQDLVHTDRDVLYYVLSHLMNNAIKFTKEGGIVIGAQPTDEGVRVSVKDSGIGIPITRQKDIFKKFTQADFSSTRQFEGSGLGLSIAAEYVSKLQSEIKLNSEEGQGAEFYFVLPSAKTYKPYVAELPVINKAMIDANSKTPPPILLAEDDDVSYEFVYKVLSKSGYTILAARNGADAIELFKDNPQIGLVIMDLRMPVLDGFEATKAIRKLNSVVPIVALTAYTLSDERRQAFDAGCNECLKKPINKDQILEMVKNYL